MGTREISLYIQKMNNKTIGGSRVWNFFGEKNWGNNRSYRSGKRNGDKVNFHIYIDTWVIFLDFHTKKQEKYEVEDLPKLLVYSENMIRLYRWHKDFS